MISRRTFFLGSLTITGCAATNSLDALSYEESHLYSLLLAELECPDEEIKRFVVSSTQSFSEENQNLISTRTVNRYLSNNESRLGLALTSMFRSINMQSHKIKFSHKEKDCVKIITDAEAKKIEPTINAGTYYEEHRENRMDAIRAGENIPELFWPPTNIIRFSRIGINPTRDYAIVYKESFCGPLCAVGEMIEFAYLSTDWQIQCNQELWVS